MDFTILDLLIWPDDLTVSSAQIQKGYDWDITQWATFGNAVLTAIFGLLASALVETYKNPKHNWQADESFWMLVGITAFEYALIYVFCRLRIVNLRKEFLSLYTLLLAIK
jgi:hypothetical protein